MHGNSKMVEKREGEKFKRSKNVEKEAERQGSQKFKLKTPNHLPHDEFYRSLRHHEVQHLMRKMGEVGMKARGHAHAKPKADM